MNGNINVSFKENRMKKLLITGAGGQLGKSYQFGSSCQSNGFFD